MPPTRIEFGFEVLPESPLNIAQGLGRADADSAKSVLMDSKSTNFWTKESWRKDRWTAAGRKNFGKSWKLFGRLELGLWTYIVMFDIV